MFFAVRYGLIRNECELIDRYGLRLRVRPNADDLRGVMSMQAEFRHSAFTERLWGRQTKGQED